MTKPYEPPTLETIGTVHELTQQQLDKVGSAADILTELLPDLDGDIIPEP